MSTLVLAACLGGPEERAGSAQESRPSTRLWPLVSATAALGHDQSVEHAFTVPAGATSLRVQILPLEGDQDMYVHNQEPGFEELGENEGLLPESALVQSPVPGPYSVKVYGAKAGRYSLKVAVEIPSDMTLALNESGSIEALGHRTFQVTVAPGTRGVSFFAQAIDTDVELYVRRADATRPNGYEEWVSENEGLDAETIALAAPEPGVYTVDVYSYDGTRFVASAMMADLSRSTFAVLDETGGLEAGASTYFSADLEAGMGTFAVELAPGAAMALEIVHYAADGAKTGTWNAANDATRPARIVLPAPAEGYYSVQVRAIAAGTFTLAGTVDTRGPTNR